MSTKISFLASPQQKEFYQSFLENLEHEFQIVPFEVDIPIVLLGGDGSLNYLLNHSEINSLATIPPVIYFPTGTANDFARSLKIPLGEPHTDKVQAILRQNKLINIPIMTCNDQCFINVASVGAPARVTNSGDDLLKKAIGKLSYYIAGLDELLNAQTYKLRYHLGQDESEQELETRGFVVSQGLYAGGGVKISPSYSPNFGDVFNFVALDSVDLTASCMALIEMQKEVPQDDDIVISHYCQDLQILSDQVTPAKLDGEEYSAQEFVFRKTAQSINFYLH